MDFATRMKLRSLGGTIAPVSPAGDIEPVGVERDADGWVWVVRP